MKFSISKVLVHATTASGPFGTELELQVGLNVVKAPNTSGKSTRPWTHNDLIQILTAANLTAARKFIGSLS